MGLSSLWPLSGTRDDVRGTQKYLTLGPLYYVKNDQSSPRLGSTSGGRELEPAGADLRPCQSCLSPSILMDEPCELNPRWHTRDTIL